MKSKFFFIIVFSALLLNIFHDFFVDNELYNSQTVKQHTLVCETQQSSHYNSLCHLDIHYLFHFVALIDDSKALYAHKKIRRAMQFFDKLSSKQVLEGSFKPPRC
jgi:hypothetical protein